MSQKTDSIIFTVYIVTCILIFALFGCTKSSAEAKNDGQNMGEIILVAQNESHFIWRYYDNETNSLCYVTESGGISCEFCNSSGLCKNIK